MTKPTKYNYHKGLRQIVMGIVVIIMAITLRQTWMIVTQVMLGCVLLGVGISRIKLKL